MFIPGFIHNLQEAVGFCNRYGISFSVKDGNLVVAEPPKEYVDQYFAMEKAVHNLEGFYADHINCFLSDEGNLLLTFSNYDGELTEKGRQKMRRKGYDLRESGFDLYGFGTTTYVMAELISPLD